VLFISRDGFFGIDEYATGKDQAVICYCLVSDLYSYPELVIGNVQKLLDLIKQDAFRVFDVLARLRNVE
jgi:hypothetical protein